MERFVFFLLLLLSGLLHSQEDTLVFPLQRIIITPEISLGITAAANSLFPERSLQKQLTTTFAREHDHTQQPWAQLLKGPRTGVSVGITDFGNSEKLGYALTAMPIIEFNAFRSDHLKLQIGTGGSYFTRKYDSISNPNNQAVTTNVTWSFKLFALYQFTTGQPIDWRLGLGYFHHSNGHTKLPNQGYNSFLLSLSGDLNGNLSPEPRAINSYASELPHHNRYTFTEIRYGFGYNVLAKSFNNPTEVHTIAAEKGWVYNETFKIGFGAYYRFYRGYYDYIKGNESLVQPGREFDHFRKNPLWYASNIGVTAQGELLLNHIGISLQLGLNLHKPAYKIDWRINQGWSYVPRIIPEQSNVVLGEFNTKYTLKQLVSSRLGLKYYLIGTTSMPVHNMYIGCFINSNLGQADYTELSLGYVHNFNFREKK